MRTGTLTSISIIATAALGAALIGVLGAYVALPEIAPSVATDTSDAQAASARDSTGQVASARDSTARGEMTGSDGEESAVKDPAGPSAEKKLRALRDSIDTLRRRLRDTSETADTLRSNLADADAEQAKVNELSNALMEMRRRNLGNLLKDVDMSVLKKLYEETSGQSRTRLLQSMAPAQAAQFVNQVVEAGSTSAPRSESGS